MSKIFPQNAWLPRLTDYANQFPILRGLTTHLGLIFGLLAAVVVWFILYRSHWGYEIRLIGDNPQAAHYAGISIVLNTILVMMLSGALAGLAGMSEISGVVHRLQGTHFTGLWFHRDYHRLAGKVKPVHCHPGIDLVWGVDPGGA